VAAVSPPGRQAGRGRRPGSRPRPATGTPWPCGAVAGRPAAARIRVRSSARGPGWAGGAAGFRRSVAGGVRVIRGGGRSDRRDRAGRPDRDRACEACVPGGAAGRPRPDGSAGRSGAARARAAGRSGGVAARRPGRVPERRAAAALAGTGLLGLPSSAGATVGSLAWRGGRGGWIVVRPSAETEAAGDHLRSCDRARRRARLGKEASAAEPCRVGEPGITVASGSPAATRADCPGGRSGWGGSLLSDRPGPGPGVRSRRPRPIGWSRSPDRPGPAAADRPAWPGGGPGRPAQPRSRNLGRTDRRAEPPGRGCNPVDRRGAARASGW